MALKVFESSLAFIRRLRSTREEELAAAQENPFLAKALEREKFEGHQLATFARTVALAIIVVLIPILTPQWHMIYYMSAVLLFIAIGWLQLWAADVGQSRLELMLIFADLVLLTILFVVPNPLQPDDVPTAFSYRFDNFSFFFLFMALGMLAYSWRTVWAMGFWIAICWAVALLLILLFGRTMPEWTEATNALYPDSEMMRWALDPNSVMFTERLEEIVVVIMIGIILGLKGARSNRLLMEQANIAAERANLSRYFPASLVDTLASTQHDIGAVRNQDVAVLFTDIVGFTQFAEEHPADEVMSLLRSYHNVVEKAVFQNKGTLDKYLGDGAMATFGTPDAGPNDAQNALKAAQQLLVDMNTLNEQRQRDGLDTVRISVGVHFGPVTLGDIGSARRLEFAVIGDTVNVASRLEAASRELDCQCVVSDDLMRRVSQAGISDGERRNGFEPRRGLQLRGRRTPIDVWTV
ncbi:MAG: adenylate/guanylate cyclase domain-containing protein [Ahrensia sp.]|nr:adenylate/guanylate cyclase domain-containing protein [Ahrensia sp.]